MKIRRKPFKKCEECEKRKLSTTLYEVNDCGLNSYVHYLVCRKCMKEATNPKHFWTDGELKPRNCPNDYNCKDCKDFDQAEEGCDLEDNLKCCECGQEANWVDDEGYFCKKCGQLYCDECYFDHDCLAVVKEEENGVEI